MRLRPATTEPAWTQLCRAYRDAKVEPAQTTSSPGGDAAVRAAVTYRRDPVTTLASALLPSASRSSAWPPTSRSRRGEPSRS
jgi:hypothetical protein